MFAHLTAWWNPWFVEPLLASWTGGVKRLVSGCMVAGVCSRVGVWVHFWEHV